MAHQILSEWDPAKRFQYQSGNYRIQDTHVRDQCDFSDAVRGKFYRKDAITTRSACIRPPDRTGGKDRQVAERGHHRNARSWDRQRPSV